MIERFVGLVSENTLIILRKFMPLCVPTPITFSEIASADAKQLQNNTQEMKRETHESFCSNFEETI